MISAAQMQFTVAEAIERYGIAGDAEAMYKSAIMLSMEQHSVFVQSDYDAYYANNGVKYGTVDGTIDSKYKQIAQQKWLSTYMQDGIEAWTEYRRLGWPDFKPGPASALTEMPRRLKYHADDYGSNEIKYNEVIARQGSDEITTRIWWDK